MAPTDDMLLTQVVSGNRVAFAALYDRFAAPVYGIARRVVVDPSMADEVTQEVFLAVWTRSGGFDPARGSARSWILTIAHRRAVDVVRREQAGRTRLDRVAVGMFDRPFDEVSETAVDRVVGAARADDVGRALRSLSPLQRSAIELAYFQGHTYREVAEILGVPLATAKTRIRDGLRALGRQLDRGGALDPA